MKSSNRFHSIFVRSFLCLALSFTVIGCGKDVTLQSNPLAGPDQAYFSSPTVRFAHLGSDFLQRHILGIRSAYAAVSSFNTFKMCVSEVVWELESGTAGTSSDKPLNPGLLDFSPTSTTAVTIGILDIAPGAVLKNIKFTIATKPELCGGENFAVLFNAGSSGDRQVTQDMSFRFDFPAGGREVAAGDDLTVYLGDIVNGMAALGSSLDNSTIQTVNVGQAK